MKSTPDAHITEVDSLFDYIKEAYTMLCSFETIEDYQAIDPTKYGFDTKFVSSLGLSKPIKKELIKDLQEFKSLLNQKDSYFEDHDLPDLQWLRSVIDRLLSHAKNKDAYVIYREIVKRY